MTYDYFSHNGEILPIEQARVPLGSVEYSYGFGVYETIRLAKNTVYFADDHCQRLLESARILGLEHSFSAGFIKQSIRQLLDHMKVETANVKLLLIGGKDETAAALYIICTDPLFPDRKLYKTGAHTITYEYQRLYPHAKSLNMLGSYLAYRQATRAGAYDALLVNANGEITEGTRTNFFTMKGRQICTPPAGDILLGVTRDKVLKVAAQDNYEIVEKPVKITDLPAYDAAFLTSTSSKIMPVISIDQYNFAAIGPALTELMRLFSEYLDDYRAG